MEIDSGTLRALEWDKLVLYLASECQSTVARKEVERLILPKQRTMIEKLLAETQEAASLLREHSFGYLNELTDLSNILGRLSARATLVAEELVAVRTTLRLSKTTKGALSNLPTESFPQLIAYSGNLSSIAPLYQASDSVIDEQGQIRDEASPALKALRREVQSINRSITQELNRFIRSTDLAKAIQEPLYTQRNNRYVLPVVASMRNLVPGIVHDSSASGLTVYVEPLSVVELSNKLRIKELELEREILRILAETSTVVSEHASEVEFTHRTLIDLDKIFARAALGIKYDGIVPSLSSGNTFELHEARHPLLILQNPSHQVIGNDLVFRRDQAASIETGTTLVITGPNTGGKTVLLKTIGLLSLMLRAGLMLPVKHGSTARIFSEIYADIGDEQSLEQSLSTFSAHMRNIVDILASANQTSLVLLDEVGAGTDPKEGAALAQAIMEFLNDLGAFTVVTTHLVELKTLAYENPGFVNASFEFDEISLVPTYKLHIGLAGRSQATAIAQRLGLNARVVERTQQLLKDLDTNIDRTINALETSMTQAIRREEVARQLEENIKHLKDEYEAKLDQLDKETETVRHSYANQLNSEFDNARDIIRQITRELQKQPGLARAQEAQAKLENMKRKLDWPSTSSAQPTDQNKLLQPGQKVVVKSLNQSAILDQLPNDVASQSDPIVQVKVGHIKLRVPLSDLKSDLGSSTAYGTRQRAKPKTRPMTSTHALDQKQFIAKQTSASGNSLLVRTEGNTLDLRGLRVEEALSNLTVFLNGAILSETSPLLIIHGHGTGALRSAVRQELSQSDYPVNFRGGEAHEGGDGVTVIFLH